MTGNNVPMTTSDDAEESWKGITWSVRKSICDGCMIVDIPFVREWKSTDVIGRYYLGRYYELNLNRVCLSFVLSGKQRWMLSKISSSKAKITGLGTVWPNGKIIFSNLAIYNTLKFDKQHTQFAKLDSIFCQILN